MPSHPNANQLMRKDARKLEDLVSENQLKWANNSFSEIAGQCTRIMGITITPANVSSAYRAMEIPAPVPSSGPGAPVAMIRRRVEQLETRVKDLETKLAYLFSELNVSGK